eukprot:g690.t1
MPWTAGSPWPRNDKPNVVVLLLLVLAPSPERSVHALGFLATNKQNIDLAFVSYFLGQLPPSSLDHASHEGFTFASRKTAPAIYRQGGIVCLVHGAIYNCASASSYEQCAVALYQRHGGEAFAERLNGDFSLVLFDFQLGIAITVTDVFATKPLWMSVEGSHVGFATHASALRRLRFHNVTEVPPNTRQIYNLDGPRLHDVQQVHQFQMSAFKDHIGDYLAALQKAVQERSMQISAAAAPVILPLSAGFDSGILACMLTDLEIPHALISIAGLEPLDLLAARFAAAGSKCRLKHLIRLSKPAFDLQSDWLSTHCEFYDYTANVHSTDPLQGDLRLDPGSVGLSKVLEFARKTFGTGAQLVVLSGSGNDFVMPYSAEYHDNGQHRNTLLTARPTIISNPQRSAEYVSNAHGVEARYPLLDPAVVQEFLWLTHRQKAAHPRKPLYDYMMRHNYPIDFSEKKGFEALGLTRSSDHRGQILGLTPQFIITSPRRGACTSGGVVDVEWDVEHANRRAAVPFLSNFSQHTVCLALDAADETCVDRPSLDIDLFPTLRNLQPGCHHLVAWLQDAAGVATSSVGSTFFEVVGNDGLCLALNCAVSPFGATWGMEEEAVWVALGAKRPPER